MDRTGQGSGPGVPFLHKDMVVVVMILWWFCCGGVVFMTDRCHSFVFFPCHFLCVDAVLFAKQWKEAYAAAFPAKEGGLTREFFVMSPGPGAYSHKPLAFEVEKPRFFMGEKIKDLKPNTTVPGAG